MLSEMCRSNKIDVNLFIDMENQNEKEIKYAIRDLIFESTGFYFMYVLCFINLVFSIYVGSTYVFDIDWTEDTFPK